jgi:hypothetical protein
LPTGIKITQVGALAAALLMTAAGGAPLACAALPPTITWQVRRCFPKA